MSCRRQLVDVRIILEINLKSKFKKQFFKTSNFKLSTFSKIPTKCLLNDSLVVV